MAGSGKSSKHDRIIKMVKQSFSKTWKRSTQTRKQRKYRYNAPLHVKQKMAHVHLSKELREKHGFRNAQVKKGDKVKILRGKFSKKEGKVERVDLKDGKVYVTGMEMIKKDGTKVLASFDPSNLMITTLDTSGKKRKVTARKGAVKEAKAEKKEAKTSEKKEVKEEKKEEKKIEEKTQ